MTHSVQDMQEQGHGSAHDYRRYSTHLRHQHVYDRFVRAILRAVAAAVHRGLPRTVLEVGAGHGAFVEPLLASGASVAATEMSRPSIATLVDRFGANPSFRVCFDADGSLAVLGDERYSVILFASVLHHIPDYLAALRLAITGHLLPGGTVITIQDPLWYPGQCRLDRVTERAIFLLWRVTQGNLGRGLRTQLRRIRGVYDTSNPADMVEYHVVRQGVNQDEIVAALQPHFETVRLRRYWTTPIGVLQRIGERAGLVNQFMITATGYRPPAQSPLS